MKILYLSYWFPYPPNNGARQRDYYHIRALGKHHEVYLMSFLQEDSDPVNGIELESICKVVFLKRAKIFDLKSKKALLGYLSKKPRSFIDTFDSDFKMQVDKAINNISPDLIIISSLGMTIYLPHNCKIPALFDEHNCEYAVIKRSAERAKGVKKTFKQITAYKSAKWETSECGKYNLVTVVSEKDKDLLLSINPSLDNIKISPNGVDTILFDIDLWKPQQNLLLYNGAISYYPNHDAVMYYQQSIYPEILKIGVDPLLQVTGPYSNEIKEGSGVVFTGYIDDMKSVLYKSAACVIPLREGGGTRLKILEAMAAGVPVVSTSIGIEGIDALNGIHALIADTPFDFAECVYKVLSDASFAKELSVNARKLVQEKYCWSRIGFDFVNMAEEASAVLL